MHSLIDFCFDGGTCKFIGITQYGARWAKDKKGFNIYFDKHKIKDAITYLLDNCHFTVGSELLCQIIGIPMGMDPSPFFANFFLYFYERKWMIDLKKRDIGMARKFGNIFRFIDDLNAMNDAGEFEKHFLEIYPPELQLSRENDTNDSASFLDLDIKIVNRKFEIGLYDKRDSFPFSIVRMPHKSSNLPSNIFYSCIGAEILRIVRATNSIIKFKSSTSKIIKRMFDQGAKDDKVKSIIRKFFGRHVDSFSHLYNNINDLIESIL